MYLYKLYTCKFMVDWTYHFFMYSVYYSSYHNSLIIQFYQSSSFYDACIYYIWWNKYGLLQILWDDHLSDQFIVMLFFTNHNFKVLSTAITCILHMSYFRIIMQLWILAWCISLTCIHFHLILLIFLVLYKYQL